MSAEQANSNPEPDAAEPATQDWRSDARLFEAINRGDASAFETLYRRHREWVFKLAHRFTANHTDALDVLQETFAYLLNKAPELSLTARTTTYLYPIVKNLSLTMLRKKHRGGAALNGPADLTAPPPRSAGLHPDLENVLAALGEAHREVLLMRILDDMTQEEIAQALGIPVGTVKSRLHHAMARLRADAKTREYFEIE